MAVESVDKRRQQLIEHKVNEKLKEAQAAQAELAEAATAAAVAQARAEVRGQQFEAEKELQAKHDEQMQILARQLKQAETRSDAAAAALRKMEPATTELEKKRQQLADSVVVLQQAKASVEGEKAQLEAELASKRMECDGLIPQLAQQTLRADAAETKLRQVEGDRDELEDGILRVASSAAPCPPRVLASRVTKPVCPSAWPSDARPPSGAGA